MKNGSGWQSLGFFTPLSLFFFFLPAVRTSVLSVKLFHWEAILGDWCHSKYIHRLLGVEIAFHLEAVEILQNACVVCINILIGLGLWTVNRFSGKEPTESLQQTRYLEKRNAERNQETIQLHSPLPLLFEILCHFINSLLVYDLLDRNISEKGFQTPLCPALRKKSST